MLVPTMGHGFDSEGVMAPGIATDFLLTVKFRAVLVALLKQPFTAETDRVPETNEVGKLISTELSVFEPMIVDPDGAVQM